MSAQALRASFRDPSGFLFEGDDGQLYRQVNRRYQPDFEMLHKSGLYDELASRGLLINHDILDNVQPFSDDGFCVIRPRRIGFISYPYEWAFSALKDAALLTLDVQVRALNHDMQLKDASAYNVQFDGCRPLLIDTLSFERLDADKPWKAYGQFCRHFLAPLALMARTHVDCGYLLQDYIDGIPLDVASSMLPMRTRWSLGLQLHLHWHARMIAKHQATRSTSDASHSADHSRRREVHMPKNRLQAYLGNLRNTISSLRPKCGRTQWADYYEDNSYSPAALQEKQAVVERYLKSIQPGTVWDLGANTGVFSRIASELGSYTCAFDIDPACVERSYLDGRKQNKTNFLPLRMDLTNPSPALGWAHHERESFASRGPADAAMALALIHHLAISNNVPLPAVADFFRRLAPCLIIEFVPKQDSQVQRLLQNRDDIFDDYNQPAFEQAFERHFHLRKSQSVGTDGRRIYLMYAR
jgi:ribosomal protein L11 methylase PrmA